MKMNFGTKLSQKTLGILLLILIISVALLLGMYLRKPLRFEEGMAEGMDEGMAVKKNTPPTEKKAAGANSIMAKINKPAIAAARKR